MLLTTSERKTSTAFVTWSSLWVVLSSLLVQNVHAATSDDWRSQSIYQLITDRFARTDGSTTYACNNTEQLYCGGTFQGIINQLDYIQDMGFTAIWISPVVQNINETTKYGQGYHGFWSQDITKINEHFGTADDLKLLSSTLHDRGMYLMIDVVINDMAYAGKGSAVDYSSLVPFDKEEYFHPFCYISDYTKPTNFQNCWLGDDIVSLPDLDTESDFVKQTWGTWVTEMVANYSLDGLRIDAAKHVDKPFWPGFQEAANTFTIGEVFDELPANACEWAVDALSSVLNYPAWYYITSILSNSTNGMGSLDYQFDQTQQNCYDTTLLGTFSENHDVARFGSYTSDEAQRKNALTFDFFTDGIPVVYYGAEQGFDGGGDPQNRGALWLNPGGYDKTSTLYQLIKTLNTARNAVNNYMISTNYSNWSPYWAYKSSVIYKADDILVFRKGLVHSVVTAITNVGTEGATVGPYYIGDNGADTKFSEGNLLIEILSCNSTVAGIGGTFTITLTKGEPQVWVSGSLLVNTTLCPTPMKNVNKTQTATKTTTSSLSSHISPSSMLSFLTVCVLSSLFLFF
ncbi:alpha-amylase [Sclerotinia borealis F-4128]|uniref:alpha-amylase n=1 Tax=Sclerotinia borealis (strain F-4128) TaxID=1432307 RepID=W9CE79_SCLBF|nr:alpha-amylase [Sclerotinia borealis F-4128]